MNNSFLSLGRIVGPLWAGFAFDTALNMPNYTGAAIMMIGFAVSLVAITPKETQAVEEIPALGPDEAG